jgi:iron complex outermembrane receptor protein
MPDLKGKAFVNYVAGDHNFYGALNYISAYDDRRSNLEVTPHTTVDATYTYSWDESFDISLSVYNLTDEDPSYVSNEMNYDPYTHSPLGRYIKAGFTYRMQ